jgi:hypothetical protein
MSAALEYRDRIEKRLYPIAYAIEVIAAGNYANGERGVQYWDQSQWQAFFWTKNYCHHRKWLQPAAPNQSFLWENERVKLSKPYVYLLVRNRQLENVLIAGWNASFRSERGGIGCGPRHPISKSPVSIYLRPKWLFVTWNLCPTVAQL